jgi:hypothetical protein
MYSLRTPKYSNYVGTKLATAASYAKIRSTIIVQILIDILAKIMSETKPSFVDMENSTAREGSLAGISYGKLDDD